MPTLTLQISSRGPLVRAILSPTDARLAAVAEANIEPPQPVEGIFLIDTGATFTLVDKTLLKPLGLSATGQIGTHTPSTSGQLHMCNQYDVKLIIPSGKADQPSFAIAAMPVLETDFSVTGINGLIGRDVLSRCVLVYNGTAGMYSLSY